MVIVEYNLFNAWFMFTFLIPTLSMMFLCQCSFHVFFVNVPLYVFVASPFVYAFYFPILKLCCVCAPCGWHWISAWPTDLLWGPPSLLFNGYWRSLPVVKRPGRDVNHWPLFSADVKNEWSCTSSRCIRLRGVNRVDCTFYQFCHCRVCNSFHLNESAPWLYTAVCSSQLNPTSRRCIML